MSDKDEGENASNRGSSRSTTPNSTSTYEYSHEPYETYQAKVTSLTHTLGKFEDVVLERLRGGSYNRVIKVRLVRDEKSFAGIFRIPRASKVRSNDDQNPEGIELTNVPTIDTEVLGQVAVLQLLESNDIAAPKLLAFDASANNPIGSPYVLQRFAEGIALDELWEGMSLPDKLSVVDSYVDALLSQERVTFSKVGVLQAAEYQQLSTTGCSLGNSPMPVIKHDFGGFTGFDIGGARELDSSEPYDSLSDFVSKQLDAWYQKELELEKDRDDHALSDDWRKLCDICEEMATLGFCTPPSDIKCSYPTSVLFHWDFFPRNILVKRVAVPLDDTREEDGGGEYVEKWIIDKVLDWDRVYAAPPVLTRTPPVWLWDFKYDQGRTSLSRDPDGDVDFIPVSIYRDTEESKISTEGRQIKKYFERRYVHGLSDIYEGYDQACYEDEAYGRGRWIRRLAKFAIYGMSSNEDGDRLDRLIDEWSEACPRFTCGQQRQTSRFARYLAWVKSWILAHVE